MVCTASWKKLKTQSIKLFHPVAIVFVKFMRIWLKFLCVSTEYIMVKIIQLGTMSKEEEQVNVVLYPDKTTRVGKIIVNLYEATPTIFSINRQVLLDSHSSLKLKENS